MLYIELSSLVQIFMGKGSTGININPPSPPHTQRYLGLESLVGMKKYGTDTYIRLTLARSVTYMFRASLIKCLDPLLPMNIINKSLCLRSLRKTGQEFKIVNGLVLIARFY